MTEPEGGTRQGPVRTEFTDQDAATLGKTPLLSELSDADRAAIRPHTHVVTL